MKPLSFFPSEKTEDEYQIMINSDEWLWS